jgi:hypothetical protein
MQHSIPTGSVSGRYGWEWNRIQSGSESGQHAPDQPSDDRNPQQRIERLEREVARLRTELQHREQQQAAIIRQYERQLAEKNRQVGEQSESETLVDAVVDQIR